VPSDPLSGLRGRIADARRTRAELEAEHAREVGQLRARIAERRLLLTERHPEIQVLRGTQTKLEAEPAALADARRRESALVEEYGARGGDRALLAGDGPLAVATANPVASPAPATPAPPRADVAPVIVSTSPDDEDDTLAYERALLKSLMENYQDLLGRLANVRVELQTARAAFPYRYSITAPARFPKEPDSPNAILLVVGALLAGSVAGYVGAVFAELRSRSLTSPAAIRRFLAAEAA
jgi:uncharacterized protein involved in exopolysaccharide biosynthesis